MVDRIEEVKYVLDERKVGSVEGRLSRMKKSCCELREVAEEFEALFVNLMLREMKKNVGETGFLKGYREDIFKDFLYWEYSKLIARNTNLGIAEKIIELYRQNS